MPKAQKQEKSMEAALWESANKLRGNVEPSEYKHVVNGRFLHDEKRVLSCSRIALVVYHGAV